MMMMKMEWTRRFLIFTTVCSFVIACVSIVRVATEITHIAAIRHRTVALVGRNELAAARLEGSLPDVAASVRDASGRLVDKALELQKQVANTHAELSRLMLQKEARRLQAMNNNNNSSSSISAMTTAKRQRGKKENVKAASSASSSSGAAPIPLVFAQGGSHVLEGGQNIMSLEQRWGYDQSSGELQLHRQLLGQVAVAARTLEAQCALAAWREYLGNFIAWMAARDDTMLYNWI